LEGAQGEVYLTNLPLPPPKGDNPPSEEGENVGANLCVRPYYLYNRFIFQKSTYHPKIPQKYEIFLKKQKKYDFFFQDTKENEIASKAPSRVFLM